MKALILALALALAASVCAKSQGWDCSTVGYIETCNLVLDAKDISVTAKTAPNPQQQANWCWLASIEMAFRYHGYAVPQQKLLEELWGSIEDMPGKPAQIIGATNRVYVDDNAKRFRAESAESETWYTAAGSLAQNIPVLVGYNQPGGTGHMTMVVGIQVQALYNNANQVIDMQISDVLLWDPWPGVGLRPMTQTEFDNTSTLVAVKATSLPPVVSLVNRPQAVKPSFRFRYDVAGRRLR